MKSVDGRPISRILSRKEVASLCRVIISLGFELPRTSSDLPEDLDRASRFAELPYEPCRCLPIWPCTGRRLPCQRCHHHRGGLLPHRFTLT